MLSRKENGKGDPKRKWIKWIQKEFGSYSISDGLGIRMLLAYPINGPQVPRIPPPLRYRSPGAHLTTVQNVSTFTGGTGFTSNSAGAITITQNTNGTVMVATSFQLVDLTQASTFGALFDQYRLEAVHLKIRPRNTQSFLASVASPNQEAPRVYAVIDRDDAQVLPNLSAAQEYDNCTEIFVGQALDVVLEPSPTRAIYSAGAFSGYEVVKGGSSGPWIDLANTTVPYYAVKMAITPLQSTSTYAWLWDVEAWYQVSFKDPR